jgi:peptidyl-prolyl cis-trans isomerase D
MVKPFDEAVFQMKQGDIAGPIESPFGYHVIRLTGVKGRGFDDVKKQIELDIKRQRAGKRFSELAEQFNNLVFEQGDSLKPAADALKLPVQHGAWISRGRAEVKQLNHPKLLQAVFAEDVVKNKRNTEVVDVGNNTLVAARIVEYQPASVRPYAEVSAEITKKLMQQQELQIAAKRGREMLDKLKKGESVAVNWSAPKLVSRENPQEFGAAATAQAFRADAAKLPAYVGVENAEGGFVLIKVTRVAEADKIDGEKRKAAREQLRQLVAQEELTAYVEGLKRKSDVKIQRDQLGKKEE